MEIGRARPLCCFSWIFCCVMAAYVSLSPSATQLAIALLVALVISTLVATLAILLRRYRPRVLFLFFLSLSLVFGCAVSLVHEKMVERPLAECLEGSSNGTYELNGLVISQEVESDYIDTFGVRVELPNGVSTLLYLNVTGENNIRVGDQIGIAAELVRVTVADEEAWRIRSLRADGYTLVAYANRAEQITRLSEGNFVLRVHLSQLQHQLAAELARTVGGEAGKLTSALLLGTRDSLSDLTVLDFRRAGASHLLALSGLHLSLIMLMISALLRALRCPYCLQIPVLSLVAILFLLLTGCSISTLRATVMLLCLHLSRLRGAPHDALTPLSVFFGACLALRPSWLFDAGLWLTVLATLAVVEIIPALFRRENERPLNIPLRILRTYIMLPVISSCIVLLVLIIPMAILFGEISLLSPVSNLLLTPLATLSLAMGLLLLPLLHLAEVWPLFASLTELLALLLRRTADAMLNVTATLSDVRGALLSLRYDFVPYLLFLLLILLLVFLFFKWKKPIRFLSMAAGWIALFAICTIVSRVASADWRLTYTLHGKSELIALNRADSVVLCDLTDGSYTAYRDLFRDGLPDGGTEIEALVLTHYHNRHISTICQLLGDYRVRTVWLPLTMPSATQEKALQDEGIARSIAAFAQTRRVEIRYYLPEEGAEITDTLMLEQLYYDMIKRSTHPTLAMCWSYHDAPETPGNRLVLLGASSWEGTHAPSIMEDIAASDALILSGHGPIIKSEYDVPLWADEPSLLLFANGDVAAALIATPETTDALAGAELVLAEIPHTQIQLP